MKKTFFGVTAGFFAAALVSGGAYAQQQIEGINVEASRVVKTTIAHWDSGVPINAISLSYRVSYSDLNLATSDGMATLEKRVDNAAKAACAEIGRLYPNSKPGERECTKATAEAAMVKVHQIVPAADKAHQ